MQASRIGGKDIWADASDETLVSALMYLYQQHQNALHRKDPVGYYGFHSTDADLLCGIAEQVSMSGQITDRQLWIVRYKIPVYWKRLTGAPLAKFRVDFAIAKFAPGKKIATEKKIIVLDDDTIKLVFSYNKELIAQIKTIQGRAYHNATKPPYWTCPVNKQSLKTLQRLGFKIPDTLMPHLTEESHTFDFSGLKTTLRPYQVAGATRLAGELRLNGLLADEQGLGKTGQALAALHAARDIAFPALIICPGSLKWNWAREVVKWLGEGYNIRILNGRPTRSQFRCRSEKDIAIINYDILADFAVAKTKKVQAGWAQLLTSAGFQTVIFDECHKLKNPKAKRTKAILEMIKQIPNRIALSGTPIESRPIEFFTTLQIVAPKLFPNYWQFGVRYCGAVADECGQRFSGASNIEELHEILIDNCMIRRLKADVLSELPKKTRSVIPVEINMKEYQKYESEMIRVMQELKGDPRAQMNILTSIEVCKQAAVRGKMKQAINFIEDYLETGRKLVVFTAHTFVIDELQKKFRNIAVRVDGKVIGEKRQFAVDAFQNDNSIRLFIGNIKAAGVGLTLTAAQDTLTLELGWTPGEHEQAEDRVHRIGQKADSVTAYYLIAKGTIEDYIMSVIDGKREVLEQVLNGKKATQQSLLSALIREFSNRKE